MRGTFCKRFRHGRNRVSFLERLETSILFRVTRVFSICVISILVVLLGVSLYGAFGTLASAHSYPEPDEVFAKIAPPTQRSGTREATQARNPDLSSLKLPFSVQRYFCDPSNRSRLLEQISGLPPEQRSGYVRNLAAVIEEADKTSSGAAENAIYVYMQITTERQQVVAAGEAALDARRLQLVGAAVASLMLIGLFSLILVLLAIERNTRSNRTPA